MSLAPQAKRALRIALWAIFSMALVAGIGIWWIAHDEPLLPEVEAALRFDPPTPEVMRDNGYFTMLGLGAPPEEDALAAGQRFFAAQVKDYEEYQRAGNLEKSSAYDAFPHQSIIMEPIRCDATADDCYAHYLENAQAIKDKLAGQKVLVERYLSLRDKPDYEEINQSPCAACALPYFSYVAAASELTTMRAALLLNDGHVDEALTLLETNAKIHRKMMEGARTLVGAMIALAMDMRQQRLISSALRHVPALSADHAQRLDALVQSSAPVPLTAALEYEMKFQLAFFSTLQPTADVISLDLEHADTEREPGSWLQNRIYQLLYLPNASCNAAYRQWQESLRLSRLPPEQLKAEAAKFRQATADTAPQPWALRNYVGNVLLSIAIPDYAAYIERAHDVEGYHRLIRLQIAALHERVPPGQMADWLAGQAPELKNPYTLQPMQWDAATQSLVFTGEQAQSQNPEPKNVYRALLGGL